MPTAAWSVIAKQNLWWNCIKQKFEAWTEDTKTGGEEEEKPEDEAQDEHYVNNVKEVKEALQRQQLDQRIKEKLQGAPKSKYNAKKHKVPWQASLT